MKALCRLALSATLLVGCGAPATVRAPIPVAPPSDPVVAAPAPEPEPEHLEWVSLPMRVPVIQRRPPLSDRGSASIIDELMRAMSERDDIRQVRVLRGASVGFSCANSWSDPHPPDELAALRSHLDSGAPTPLPQPLFELLDEAAQSVVARIDREAGLPTEVVDEPGFELGGEALLSLHMFLRFELLVATEP